MFVMLRRTWNNRKQEEIDNEFQSQIAPDSYGDSIS